MLVKIPPQQSIFDSPLAELVAEKAEEASKGLVFSSMAVSMVFNFSMQTLLGSINSMQMIAHLPLNSVLFTNDLYYVFDVMI